MCPTFRCVQYTNFYFVSRFLIWQWTSTLGGLCAYEARVCDFRESTSQENWVFTQYINYLQAREVFVNISAGFTECRLAQNPRCNAGFQVNLLLSPSLPIHREFRGPMYMYYRSSLVGVCMVTRVSVNCQCARLIQWNLS